MLPVSFLLVIFPLAGFWAAAQSAAELQSFSSPGGSAGFEPPGKQFSVVTNTNKYIKKEKT